MRAELERARLSKEQFHAAWTWATISLVCFVVCVLANTGWIAKLVTGALALLYSLSVYSDPEFRIWWNQKRAEHGRKNDKKQASLNPKSGSPAAVPLKLDTSKRMKFFTAARSRPMALFNIQCFTDGIGSVATAIQMLYERSDALAKAAPGKQQGFLYNGTGTTASAPQTLDYHLAPAIDTLQTGAPKTIGERRLKVLEALHIVDLPDALLTKLKATVQKRLSAALVSFDKAALKIARGLASNMRADLTDFTLNQLGVLITLRSEESASRAGRAKSLAELLKEPSMQQALAAIPAEDLRNYFRGMTLFRPAGAPAMDASQLTPERIRECIRSAERMRRPSAEVARALSDPEFAMQVFAHILDDLGATSALSSDATHRFSNNFLASSVGHIRPVLHAHLDEASFRRVGIVREGSLFHLFRSSGGHHHHFHHAHHNGGGGDDAHYDILELDSDRNNAAQCALLFLLVLYKNHREVSNGGAGGRAGPPTVGLTGNRGVRSVLMTLLKDIFQCDRNDNVARLDECIAELFSGFLNDRNS